VYDIGSHYSCNRFEGAYRIDTSVRPDKACETVVAVKQLMQAVKTGRKKVTDAEVFQAINRKNAFLPEDYRHNEAIINNLINDVELQNRNADYLNEYIRAYNRVTAAKAQAALERCFFPEKLFTVIVGKKEAILPAFQEAGIEVTVVDRW
jgi:zinc protease